MTGYTVGFNIYMGKTTEKSDLGLAHDVVMQLVPPLTFQGYELYCDNHYLSPVLFEDLRQHGIMATSTFCTDGDYQAKWFRSRMPFLKCLGEQDIISGMRKWVLSIAYGKDTRVVSVMLTCDPGHQSEKMALRNCLGADGK